MGGGSNHWYHGDLTGRAFALLAALTGNIGQSGGGFSVYVGQYKVRVDTSPWWNAGRDEGEGLPDASTSSAAGPTTMHPDVPYPEQRLARPRLHLRQHVRPVDGRQPAPRDAAPASTSSWSSTTR